MLLVTELLGFLDFEVNQFLQRGLEGSEVIVRTRFCPDCCCHPFGLRKSRDEFSRLFHRCVILAARNANQAGFVRIERSALNFLGGFFQ